MPSLLPPEALLWTFSIATLVLAVTPGPGVALGNSGTAIGASIGLDGHGRAAVPSGR